MDNNSKLGRGIVRKVFLAAIAIIVAETMLIAYNKKIKEEKGIKIEKPAINVNRWGMDAIKKQKY